MTFGPSSCFLVWSDPDTNLPLLHLLRACAPPPSPRCCWCRPGRGSDGRRRPGAGWARAAWRWWAGPPPGAPRSGLHSTLHCPHNMASGYHRPRTPPRPGSSLPRPPGPGHTAPLRPSAGHRAEAAAWPSCRPPPARHTTSCGSPPTSSPCWERGSRAPPPPGTRSWLCPPVWPCRSGGLCQTVPWRWGCVQARSLPPPPVSTLAAGGSGGGAFPSLGHSLVTTLSKINVKSPYWLFH